MLARRKRDDEDVGDLQQDSDDDIPLSLEPLPSPI